ncbi:MAG: hypothetical protein GC179_16175 [Anaerolineaceae bacterium]|nr:hypothetical protein [Anaerolineaceae bacterium]
MDTTVQQLRSTRLQRALAWLPIAALVMLALLLWLPFGLHIGFYADDWTTMRDIQAGNFITESVRPFEVVSWYVAYHLNPTNLFVGLNLLVMLLIMGKGIVSYWLLSDLQFNKLYAFGTAALLVVYPADAGVFYLGALSIHSSILTYLLAVWLLVRFWKSGHRWLWILIIPISVLCAGIYEGIYPLILLAPLVLVYLQGGISRRVVITSLMWFVVPILMGLRVISILFLNNSTNTYQSFLFADDHSLGAILGSIWRANRYSLADSWISAALQTFAYQGWSGFRNLFNSMSQNPYTLFALAAAGVVIATSLVLIRLPQKTSLSRRRLILILLISPVLLSFGFLLYSLTNLRDLNLRTLLHASLGAALFVSTLLWLVAGILRKQAIIYAIGLTALVMMAINSQLIQHQNKVITGQSQVPFMQTLVRAMPQVESDSLVVIVDETPERELENLFHISYYFDAPVKIIYSDPNLEAVICYFGDTKAWGPFEETCRFQADQFQWLLNGQPTWTSSYNRLVVFRYEADKTLHLETDIAQYIDSDEAKRLYAPDKLINMNGALPVRAQTMLKMSP